MTNTPTHTHVPPPDPTLYWDFTLGQTKGVCYKTTDTKHPVLSFCVNAISKDFVMGTQYLNDATISGLLHLNIPVVVARIVDTGEPMVTLTLREVRGRVARIQVTANPKIQQAVRPQ